MSREPTIFVSAAERSGDLHAANLVREVRKRDSRVRFEGFGGELLREAGCSVREDLTAVASMGLGFRRHLGRYGRVVRGFQRYLRETRPDAVVLVDSPGLHFLLARLARWEGVPVIDYICPQVWAWAPWRRSKVLRYTDLLLVILPFEEELYRNPRVPVRYVGHPLVDSLVQVSPDAGRLLRERLEIGPAERVVSLLPGSREHEIAELMPIFARILAGLAEEGRSFRVVASSFRSSFEAQIREALGELRVPVSIVEEDARHVAMAGDLVLVASGTASLEVAYFERPMMVLYKAGILARLFYRLMVVTPYFTLPNILGAGLFEGEPVVHEQLCSGRESGDLIRRAAALFDEGPERERAIEKLRLLKRTVFQPGASGRAAEAVLEFLSKTRVE